jgi:hypothetical protein
MNRSDMGRLFARMGLQVTQKSNVAAHMDRELRKVDWMVHITDDIYRCACCGVEGTHAKDCPVRLLQAETAGVGR